MEGPPVFMDWQINIEKMAILLKSIYKFNRMDIKIPIPFFTEIEKVPKIHMKAQKIPNSQSNPEQKVQLSIKIPDFKLYYKAIVTKRGM
jgi:hypothetical protein